MSTGYVINMQIGRGHLAQLLVDNFITGTATGDLFPIATPLRPLITNHAQFAFTYLCYSQGSTNPLLCLSAMHEELKVTRRKRFRSYTYLRSAFFCYLTRNRVVIPYRRRVPEGHRSHLPLGGSLKSRIVRGVSEK